MAQTPARFAYRCLPLVIANSHGWELLVDQSFTATWSGGPAAEDLQISFLGEGCSSLPASHFGKGILTFQAGYLFETEERHNLWVMGPINSPKDGIMPLCGVVETDWIPYTFTMNWMLTRPGTVRFEQGEPFCHFFPIPRWLLKNVEPEIRDLESAPDKSRTYASWLTYKGQTKLTNEGWDKHYVQGQSPNGEVVAEDHETRLAVKPFTDRTSRQVARSQDGGSYQEVFCPASVKKQVAAEVSIAPAERLVRAHFMDSGSQDLTVVFPDPLLSASIACKGSLDELIHGEVAPFWLRLRQDRAASQCYLWFLRGREHLEIHLHGPEDQGPEMRRRLEEAVSDGTLLWTGYRRSDAALGGGPLLLDHRYASLITVCLACGCDFVLASLKPDDEGGITHGWRRTALLRALITGLSALGLSQEERFSYLAYHRNCLLREVVTPAPGGTGLQKAVSCLDARAEAFAEALRRLREMIAEEWTGSTDLQPAPPELGSWQRSLSHLYTYASRFGREPACPIDRWAAEPAFVPLFKVCHGIANQAGMTPVDEAFWCHLLVRARPET